MAFGFSTTYVISGQGGHDAVWLYDTSASDLGVMTADYTYLHGGFDISDAYNQYSGKFTTSETAIGFATTTAVADSGGFDTIWVYGTSAQDNLYFTPSAGTMLRSNHIDGWFSGFQTIYGQGSGSNDSANLQTGPAANIFVGGGTTGRLTSLDAHYDVILSSFERIAATAANNVLNVMTVTNSAYSLSLAGFTSSTKFFNVQPQTRAQALVQLKQLALQLDPALATAPDPLTLALMLRNDVHNEIQVGSNSITWQGTGAYKRLLLSVLIQQEPLLCGGMQILYTDVLAAFGLQARYVALFAADNFHNHASVEVLLNGKWVALDPTFNVSFVGQHGQRLSFADIQAGVPFTISRDGYTSRPILVIENVPVTIQQYCFSIQYPSTVPN
jgi:hypothetical protein